MNNNDVTCFNSFAVEHIPKELKHLLTIKKLKQIFLEYEDMISVMCGYFCIGFIHFMFKGKTLIGYTILFSPNNFEKNDDMILNYFMNNAYL